MPKLFLTGRPRCGKSSVIQKNLAGLPLSGFAMQRLTRDGETWAFRLLDLTQEPYVTHLESDTHWDDIAISMLTPEKWQGTTQVFENNGRQSLEKSLSLSRLVIMDELGIFERGALRFQQAVFNILDSDLPVLGVLKNKHTPFLDQVRAHPAVVIVEFPGTKAIEMVEALTARLRRQQP
ncbi:MAG TPA: hypothetical protein DG577_04465 [Firmicutes bacterium]|jgi:nucleoside-triphosphatase|nr:hypothetical protein [Bacillota bacterium]